MVESQSQAFIEPLTLLQGNATLIQQQRPIKAISASCCAHLVWRVKTKRLQKQQRAFGAVWHILLELKRMFNISALIRCYTRKNHHY